MSEVHVFQVDKGGNKTELSQAQLEAIRRNIFTALISGRNSHKGIEILRKETSLAIHEELPDDIVSTVKIFTRVITEVKDTILLRMAFSGANTQSNIEKLIESIEYFIGISDAFTQVSGEGLSFFAVLENIISPLQKEWQSDAKVSGLLRELGIKLDERNTVSRARFSLAFGRSEEVNPHLESVRGEVERIIKSRPTQEEVEEERRQELWQSFIEILHFEEGEEDEFSAGFPRYQEVQHGSEYATKADLEELVRRFEAFLEKDHQRTIKKFLRWDELEEVRKSMIEISGKVFDPFTYIKK